LSRLVYISCKKIPILRTKVLLERKETSASFKEVLISESIVIGDFVLNSLPNNYDIMFLSKSYLKFKVIDYYFINDIKNYIY